MPPLMVMASTGFPEMFTVSWAIVSSYSVTAASACKWENSTNMTRHEDVMSFANNMTLNPLPFDRNISTVVCIGMPQKSLDQC